MNYHLVDITGAGIQDSKVDLSHYLKRSEANDLYVNEMGDTLQGDINMNDNRINNVGDPTEGHHVLTKYFLDRTQVVTNVLIGLSPTSSIKNTKYTIPFPNLKKYDIVRCFVQPVLITTKYNDTFAVTVRNLTTKDGEVILSLNTCRVDSKSGWNLQLHAHVFLIKEDIS